MVILGTQMKSMKKFIIQTSILLFVAIACQSQDLKSKDVPTVVKSALEKKYPQAKGVSWEKEKGNYEANWGGKSGEDHSVQFTPSGEFLEIVNAIPVSELPKSVLAYVRDHYKVTPTEAGRVTDAHGKLSYEAEVHGKDIIFDDKGNFVKAE